MPGSTASDLSTSEPCEDFRNITDCCGTSRQWPSPNLLPGGAGKTIYQAADGGEITETQAAALISAYLVAGIDTTINSVSNALHQLSQHSDQWTQLRAEPDKLIPQVLLEVIRYDPPVQMMTRTVTRDVLIDEVPVRAGEGASVVCVRVPRRTPVPRTRPVRHPPKPTGPPRVWAWRAQLRRLRSSSPRDNRGPASHGGSRGVPTHAANQSVISTTSCGASPHCPSRSPPLLRCRGCWTTLRTSGDRLYQPRSAARNQPRTANSL
jgi:hypothetical protein